LTAEAIQSDFGVEIRAEPGGDNLKDSEGEESERSPTKDEKGVEDERQVLDKTQAVPSLGGKTVGALLAEFKEFEATIAGVNYEELKTKLQESFKKLMKLVNDQKFDSLSDPYYKFKLDIQDVREKLPQYEARLKDLEDKVKDSENPEYLKFWEERWRPATKAILPRWPARSGVWKRL
jgi:hypothetical protein